MVTEDVTTNLLLEMIAAGVGALTGVATSDGGLRATTEQRGGGLYLHHVVGLPRDSGRGCDPGRAHRIDNVASRI
ncbi:hypothetical protein Ciccas_004780 [Cichlidogyrus casuarinus]|uniref:Uncharacterized protein n=1 Tax=Cichlidogyrus casuarinus TaxID=1844966 RepID=A0ABD2QAJ3_9PLAT